MLILKVVLTAIHVVICIVLVVSILLQSSKGGGLAGTFGGQATSSIFGPRGAASALGTLTQYLAAGFLILSLALSLMAGAGSGGGSVTQRILEDTPASALPQVEDYNPSAQPATGSDQGQPAGAAQGDQGK